MPVFGARCRMPVIGAFLLAADIGMLGSGDRVIEWKFSVGLPLPFAPRDAMSAKQRVALRTHSGNYGANIVCHVGRFICLELLTTV